MHVGAKIARPEWTLKIEELRERLGISQAALARKLGVSPMAVSRWERGVNEPTAIIYVTLGKMCSGPECWYFWGRVGLDREALRTALEQWPAQLVSPRA
jgi:DNA-binding XRE family transcriptional regulator